MAGVIQAQLFYVPKSLFKLILQPKMCYRHRRLATLALVKSSVFSDGCNITVTSKRGVQILPDYEGKAQPHHRWLIRLANQNGYLSWSRNAYMCLSVSLAISMSAKGALPIPYDVADLSGIMSVAHLMLILAQINMLFGSGEFVYQMLRTRHLTQLSWLAVIIYSLLALAHCYLFLDVFSSLEEIDDSKSDDEL